MQMAMEPRNGPFISSNVMYWMERELLVYPASDLDLEALARQESHILLANGRESNKQARQYLANTVLAQKFELNVHHLPGAHLGFFSHAETFARDLIDALKKKDPFYAST